MDCIYIAPLSKALYNLCLSFTHSHTHSHTNGDWLPCKVPTSSSGAIGVRCLAQGHFDTPRVGSNWQPSDCQTTALTSWAISPRYVEALVHFEGNTFALITIINGFIFHGGHMDYLGNWGSPLWVILLQKRKRRGVSWAPRGRKDR